jgi:hypothetical protein
MEQKTRVFSQITYLLGLLGVESSMGPLRECRRRRPRSSSPVLLHIDSHLGGYGLGTRRIPSQDAHNARKYQVRYCALTGSPGRNGGGGSATPRAGGEGGGRPGPHHHRPSRTASPGQGVLFNLDSGFHPYPDF